MNNVRILLKNADHIEMYFLFYNAGLARKDGTFELKRKKLAIFFDQRTVSFDKKTTNKTITSKMQKRRLKCFKSKFVARFRRQRTPQVPTVRHNKGIGIWRVV